MSTPYGGSDLPTRDILFWAATVGDVVGRWYIWKDVKRMIMLSYYFTFLNLAGGNICYATGPMDIHQSFYRSDYKYPIWIQIFS